MKNVSIKGMLLGLVSLIVLDELGGDTTNTGACWRYFDRNKNSNTV